jgi:NADH-quinone oxidoreductase subunit L
MSDAADYLWLIPALPLAASVLTAFLGPRVLRQQSHWPCVLAVAASCVVALYVLAAVIGQPHDAGPFVKEYYTWFHIADPSHPAEVAFFDLPHVGLTLRADPLSAWMVAMVTFIATFIAIFSIGYMHGDPGYPRFFAEIALFVFSMTLLVLADNFILLFAGWELVGLCSYLLIGFWFTKSSAAHAARKAFLVTRLGDLGFMLGIVLLWIVFGHKLDYEEVFSHAGAHEDVIPIICLLLFAGAVGKSAQVPLYVWLPDAMEGPTPVSALIHAATMVTAGVYMVARCMPLYRHSPVALMVVSVIGALTALWAALIALTQFDLKRVLAYSTISQLGYMFAGLGAAVSGLVKFAVAAAIFHLFTHAFFKALLFLASGSVMHAMGGVIDMRRIGGLRRLMPTTHWTFLCGALALSAFPLTAGFWSKDLILAATFDASGGQMPGQWIYLVVFVLLVVTAFLTSFYTFRAYFLTFWGEEKIPHEAGHHAHESPYVMLVPLMVLAAGALLVGFVNAEPIGLDWLSGFLDRLPFLGEPRRAEPSFWSSVFTLWIPLLCSLGGIALAWLMYRRQPELPTRVADSLGGLYQLSLNKFHVDELYNGFIVQPLRGFASFCRIFDLNVLDGIVDLCGQVPRLFGFLLRPVQNGLVQFYALAMVLGLAVFLIALARAMM